MPPSSPGTLGTACGEFCGQSSSDSGGDSVGAGGSLYTSGGSLDGDVQSDCSGDYNSDTHARSHGSAPAPEHRADNIDEDFARWEEVVDAIQTSPGTTIAAESWQTLCLSLSRPLLCVLVWMFFSYSVVPWADPEDETKWWVCMVVCALKWCGATSGIMTLNIQNWVHSWYASSVAVWQVFLTWTIGAGTLVAIWLPLLFTGLGGSYRIAPNIGIAAATGASLTMALSGISAGVPSGAQNVGKATRDVQRVILFNAMLFAAPAAYLIVIEFCRAFFPPGSHLTVPPVILLEVMKFSIKWMLRHILGEVGDGSSAIFVAFCWLYAVHSTCLTVFLGMSQSWSLLLVTIVIELVMSAVKVYRAWRGLSTKQWITELCRHRRGEEVCARTTADRRMGRHDTLKYQVSAFTNLAVQHASEAVLPVCFFAASLTISFGANKNYIAFSDSLQFGEDRGEYIFRLGMNVFIRGASELSSMLFAMQACRYLRLYPFSYYAKRLMTYRWHVCFVQCWVIDTIFCTALVACNTNLRIPGHHHHR